MRRGGPSARELVSCGISEGRVPAPLFPPMVGGHYTARGDPMGAGTNSVKRWGALAFYGRDATGGTSRKYKKLVWRFLVRGLAAARC
jgi:hypothetical protein